MAKKFKLKTVKVTTRLDKKFSDPRYIARTFFSRIEKTKVATDKAIRIAIERELRKNKVIQALINPQVGVRGYDLPAEFGLKPDQAQQAVETLIGILLTTCRVNIEQGTIRTVRGKPSVAVTIRSEYLNPENYTKYLSGYPFSYISKTRNNSRTLRGKNNPRPKIDWMKWLLEANKGMNTILGTIPSVRDYGISYELTGRQKALSRSGRAIMLKDSGHNLRRGTAKNFPYKFPKVAKPSAGFKNFIDEIARNPRFTDRLQQRIQTIISYYLTPRKR